MRTLLMILLMAVGTTNLAFAGHSKFNDKNPTYSIEKQKGAIMQKIAKDVKKGKLSKAEAMQLRGQVNAIVKAQPVKTLTPDQIKQVEAQLKQIYDSL